MAVLEQIDERRNGCQVWSHKWGVNECILTVCLNSCSHNGCVVNAFAEITWQRIKPIEKCSSREGKRDVISERIGRNIDILRKNGASVQVCDQERAASCRIKKGRRINCLMRQPLYPSVCYILDKKKNKKKGRKHFDEKGFRVTISCTSVMGKKRC